MKIKWNFILNKYYHDFLTYWIKFTILKTEDKWLKIIIVMKIRAVIGNKINKKSNN